MLTYTFLVAFFLFFFLSGGVKCITKIARKLKDVKRWLTDKINLLTQLDKMAKTAKKNITRIYIKYKAAQTQLDRYLIIILFFLCNFLRLCLCVCECVNVLQEGLCHFLYPYSIFVIYMFLVDVNKVIIISRNSTTASLSHITYIFNTLRNKNLAL